MKVYITKYALTKGIFEIEAERCASINSDMISEVGIKYDTCYHGEGRQWHLTKESANKQADKMRLNKINALKAQIERLNNIIFS